MLNKRKSTDPTVNFAVVKNPKNNEIILDFILNAEDPKGDDIVEWNAYRYAALKGKGGASGVLLFGISRRGYGDDATDFLRRLKLARPAEVNALAAYPLPVVRPVDKAWRITRRTDGCPPLKAKHACRGHVDHVRQ